MTGLVKSPTMLFINNLINCRVNWAEWVRIPRQDYRKVKNKKKRGQENDKKIIARKM